MPSSTTATTRSSAHRLVYIANGILVLGIAVSLNYATAAVLWYDNVHPINDDDFSLTDYSDATLFWDALSQWHSVVLPQHVGGMDPPWPRLERLPCRNNNNNNNNQATTTKSWP